MLLNRRVVFAWIPLLLAACQGTPPPTASSEESRSTEITEQVRIVRIEHAAAEDMAAVLSELLLDGGGSVQVVAEAATNSLLLSGTESEMGEVLSVIAALDVGVEAADPSGRPDATRRVFR